LPVNRAAEALQTIEVSQGKALSEAEMPSESNMVKAEGNRYFYVYGGKVFYQQYNKIHVVNKDGTKYYQIPGLGGEFIINEDWLYIINQEGELVKCKPDGSGMVTLAARADFIFDIANGYVYYMKNDNTTRWLYAVKTDGTDDRLFGERNIGDMDAADDGYIYYTVFDNKAPNDDPLNWDYYNYTGIIRARPDGSDKQTIKEGQIVWAQKLDKYFLYAQKTGPECSELYCMDETSGQSEVMFGKKEEEAIGYIESIVGFKDGFIYFIGSNGALYRYQPLCAKGTEEVFKGSVTEDVVSMTDLDRGFMVCGNSEESYVAKLDGSNKHVLCKARATYTLIVGDIAYYQFQNGNGKVIYNQFDMKTGVNKILPDEYPQPSKPEIDKNQIDKVTFKIGSFGIDNVYQIDRKGLSLKYSQEGNVEKEKHENLATWDETKWNAFLDEMLACGVSQWKTEYNVEGLYDGTQWGLKIHGVFGDRDIWGSNDFPEQWGTFMSVLTKYFGHIIGW
jgi:hypothetical protein